MLAAHPPPLAFKDKEMLRDQKIEIEKFTSYFERQIEKTSKLQIANEDTPANIHKKIVYSAIIDALSKSVFPRRKGNRYGITSFIAQFSDWGEEKRVSLPHLFQLLVKCPEPSFSRLREYVTSNLKEWKDGEMVSLKKDPKVSEVRNHWPQEKELKKPLNGVPVEHLQHSHLFYSYRNIMVHEFRYPGDGEEPVLENDEDPFYISELNVDNEKDEAWKLVYPVKFFEKLAKNGLKNLKKYLIENNIDPYIPFTFGSYWIDELNKS